MTPRPWHRPRVAQVLLLAVKDLAHGWVSAACFSVAVTAALLPLLILFGLKFGIVTNLMDTLRADPAVREVRLLRDTELTLGWMETLRSRPEIAFLLPRANFLAGSVRIRGTDDRLLPEGTRILPTATGDPLLGGGDAPVDIVEVVLSARVAIAANAQPGDELELLVQRNVGETRQSRALTVVVIHVLPADRLQTLDILVHPDLEAAIETWRQGFAVPDLGWPAADGAMNRLRPERTSFSSFRLYVRDVRDVAVLRDWLLEQGLDVRSRADDVIRVLVIERALGMIFWCVSLLGAVGFVLTLGLHLAAGVVEKTREFAILRLLGMRSGEIALLPSIQGMMIAGAGALLACVFAALAQPAMNHFFDGLAGLEGNISSLGLEHFVWAFGATLAAGGLSGSLAGWQSAIIEPSRGLRHD